MEEKINLKFMSYMETKMWIRATIDACAEILILGKEQSIEWEKYFNSSSVEVRNLKKMDDLREAARIKEYFFIIALNKTTEWLQEAAKYDDEFAKIKDRIESEIPYIREVRNMREHEIEYYKVKGKKQINFIRQFGDHVSDATATTVNDENYLVGGRISVQKAKKVFEEIQPISDQKMRDYFLNN